MSFAGHSDTALSIRIQVMARCVFAVSPGTYVSLVLRGHSGPHHDNRSTIKGYLSSCSDNYFAKELKLQQKWL